MFVHRHLTMETPCFEYFLWKNYFSLRLANIPTRHFFFSLSSLLFSSSFYLAMFIIFSPFVLCVRENVERKNYIITNRDLCLEWFEINLTSVFVDDDGLLLLLFIDDIIRVRNLKKYKCMWWTNSNDDWNFSTDKYQMSRQRHRSSRTHIPGLCLIFI